MEFTGVDIIKKFLLFCDFVIVTSYAIACFFVAPESISHVFLLLLFFIDLRALSLAIHDAFSIGNALLLFFLWDYVPFLLILLYAFYAVLYYYLSLQEKKIKSLTEENTSLKLEAQQVRLYRLLQDKYESQITINSQLRERQRIAQEIHDLLGHSVTASILQVEAAKSIMDKEPEKSKALLSQAADSMRAGVDNIRSAVHKMRAEVPDMRTRDMQAVIDRFRRDSGMQIIYSLQGDAEKVRMDIWEALRGNLHEALSNVIRHSHATQVKVCIQVLPGVVRLEVKDNGAGSDNYSEGMGISGMRSRVSALGGTLIVRGSRGQGTTVISIIPRRKT